MVSRVLALTVLSGILAVPSDVRAQEPAILVGRVIAADGTPAPGALIRFDTGDEVLADGAGHFHVGGLEPGDRAVLVVTQDCRVSRASVELTGGGVSRVELHVPAALASSAPRPRVSRPPISEGYFLTAEEIEQMHARSVTDVIRRVAPEMVGNAGGLAGATGRLQGRDINSLTARHPPVVVIDGVRVADGARALDAMMPSDVELLDIRPGPSGGWEFGSEGASGSIRVTTRVGGEAPEAASPDRRPGDPRRCRAAEEWPSGAI